LKLGAMRQ